MLNEMLRNRPWAVAFGTEARMPNDEAVQAFRRHIEHNAEEARDVVMMLWINQTPDERRKGVTIHDNDRGYNQDDAPVLTPIARKLWRLEELTPLEDLVCQAHAGKYARQYLHYCVYGGYC